MTFESSPIVITARVHRDEVPTLKAAAEMLFQAISAVAGGPTRIEMRFEDPASPIDRAHIPQLYITSLLPSLDDVPESRDDVERRWSRYLTDLGETGAAIVLCNIFRHVPDRAMAGKGSPLIVKIRELNLLAVVLSHRLGVHVADIDRVMSVLGARRIASDYRQSGAMGADAAAYAIVQCLLRGALDPVIDPAILERAQHHWGNMASLFGLLSRRQSQRQAADAA
jgi:hypothetical protein